MISPRQKTCIPQLTGPRQVSHLREQFYHAETGVSASNIGPSRPPRIKPQRTFHNTPYDQPRIGSSSLSSSVGKYNFFSLGWNPIRITTGCLIIGRPFSVINPVHTGRNLGVDTGSPSVPSTVPTPSEEDGSSSYSSSKSSS